MGAMKGDTKSLDYSSHGFGVLAPPCNDIGSMPTSHDAAGVAHVAAPGTPARIHVGWPLEPFEKY